MLMGQFCFGQNLVLNPSFEQYDTCPDGMTRINYAIPWKQPLINISTSDYFNTCSNNIALLQCLNEIKPRTGSGYAGISPYGDSGWQEYIEIKTNEPLQFNKQYCISFFAHLFNQTTYAIDRLGALITDTMVTTDNVHNPILISPQVESAEWFFYKDTNNWERIEGSFIAHGGENWLTIGNFHKSIDTHTIIAGIYSNFYAYYLIDDVAVYECDAPVYTANAGGNKTICKGESVQIGMPRYDEYLYEWHRMDGTLVDTTSYLTVSPTATTSYVLSVKDFKFDVTTDTVTVVVDDAMCTQIYIPNIFSPNGDGQNDVFRLLGEQIASVHLQVYNRWGNMVFESNDMSYAWDGMYQGKACEVGVYAWMAEIVMKNGTNLFRKGNVSLVR